MIDMDLLQILDAIDPSALSYQEWCNVGMALKHEGYPCSVWESWSAKDHSRFHGGECEKKWRSFNGSTSPVTAGTIVQLAKDQGWKPQYEPGYELAWDGVLSKDSDDMVIVNKNWIEGKELRPVDTWEPEKQLIQYLETLFDADENVGYVTKSWEKDGKYIPANKGDYDRTAGQLIAELKKCKGDLGRVLGDYDPKAGAWIRFNPLDGKDVRNDNVTDFRYALVESDSQDIERQNAIIRELEMPVACLVYSGGKSLHAIVKIGAADYDEYRRRVDYLYEICHKNGLEIDRQNRNPSRLSRMPGAVRGEQKQYIVDTNIGKKNWDEWRDWIEGVNDDLPDPENMEDAWDHLPELSPPLIAGVLRQGHKMLLAGPSKAGKSFALIELCCALAEGKNWLGFTCAKGKVMYVNLELDRPSCLHRFKDVYTALGWAPNNLKNIDIWNLRGKSVPMDKLAPKLIRRAAKKNYIAIIIDPIYKVITGDENSADQMAHFCNQFDRVCTELGCAVIYCHHHSKGTQGQKRSMDRASGSGVFARDPDALLDLIELEISDELLKAEQNKAACDACKEAFNEYLPDTWDDSVSMDDMCSEVRMREAAKKLLKGSDYTRTLLLMDVAKERVKSHTAWRIEATLREFPKFAPVNIWFKYPAHQIDRIGVLQDADADGEQAPWKKAVAVRKNKNQKDSKDRKISLENAFDANNGFGEPVTVNQLAEYLGVSVRSIRDRVKEHGGFEIDGGIVRKKHE